MDEFEGGLFWYAGKNNKKIKYFKVWQDGNDAQEIHTTAFLEEKMNYIHNNPVKAELVGRAEDYLYSSARDYSGESISMVFHQYHIGENSRWLCMKLLSFIFTWFQNIILKHHFPPYWFRLFLRTYTIQFYFSFVCE